MSALPTILTPEKDDPDRLSCSNCGCHHFLFSVSNESGHPRQVMKCRHCGKRANPKKVKGNA